MLPNLELYKREICFNPFRLNMPQIFSHETSHKGGIFDCKYFSPPSIGEKQEKVEDEEEKSLKEDFSCSLNVPLFGENHERYNIMNLEESEDNINPNNNGDSKAKDSKKKIFKVIYRKVEDISFEQNKNTFLSKKKPRNHNYGKRYKGKDLILIKIGTNFFNDYLFNIINKIIKEEGYHFYFIRFPKEFILNAVKKKKANKKIWKMTLENIFTKKKLYSTKDLESHYNPNLNVILKLDENKNNMKKTGFNKILKMKLCDLYKDYLNSDSKKKQIDAIKKTFDDYSYVERYINFSTTFLDNFI